MLYTSKQKKFNPKFEVVSCFLQNNGQILLLHRNSDKPEGNTWGMPAGKINQQEKLYKAVLREVKEETGVKLEKSDINYFKELYVKYPKYDFIYHIFEVSLKKKPEILINESEHKAYKWVKPEVALSMNCIEDLDKCIQLFYFPE
jgi:ADP-ribose pyrophosphatase YjhB (NUDIX family)